MSERAVPTKPGLWYYRHIESHGMPDSILIVREVTAEDDDHGTFTEELVAEFSETDELLEVGNVNGTWLAPVPSAEAVQAAVANAQFILDGDGVLPAYRQLLIDMIAGLTGGEG